jgi:hypothetical protein
MPELCNSQLVESLALALETMAFVSLTPPDSPPPAPEEPVLLRIAYHGAGCGCVELVTSMQLGRLLVENTLAGDDSDPAVRPDPQDSLVELLNITCGMILKAQARGRRFEMSVPRVLAFDPNQWEFFLNGGDCDVVLADGIVTAIRMVEEQP